MASTWGNIGRMLGGYAAKQGPKLLRQLQNSRPVKRATEAIAGPPHPAATPGRPVSRTSAPTAHRARKIEYAPSLDGQADPGEIVWTWVAYEEDPGRGKDRPVLVIGRDGHTLLGLMLSSNSERGTDPDWLALGSGRWDPQSRPSWVRLDRVLDVPEEGIRREGAILDRERFDSVAARLKSDYSWH
ncbi:type II toxin-antitoxin system PemK/MazF family toxin [Rhodococcus spongiicola]|uniref:Type II toxin-antitoxin system PemK/MazF family toxin n=1 Tax=Rhodococcus spongiicola TaxID=2487352 RepID=A0A438B1L7_9NOCA|nr:type II toxin-antitoxin system PemK/MazF family toxin [Rhodococcus spongiicola]RVW04845.1 type II toxin-antitoxin system PemK/MazF family toxin [Rhodococcus spongiicola]